MYAVERLIWSAVDVRSLAKTFLIPETIICFVFLLNGALLPCLSHVTFLLVIAVAELCYEGIASTWPCRWQFNGKVIKQLRRNLMNVVHALPGSSSS